MTDTELLSLLSAEAVQIIQAKFDRKYQVVWGALCVFFQENKRFPENDDIPQLVTEIRHVGIFLNIEIYDHQTLVKKCLTKKHRTIRLFKAEIRALYGFRIGTAADQQTFINHCKQAIFPNAPKWDEAIAGAYDYLHEQKLEPYSEKQLKRLLATAHKQFEDEFFTKIEQNLKPETKIALDALLKEAQLDISSNKQSSASPYQLTLTALKSERVELKINSILDEVQKYQALDAISIPNIEHHGSRKLFEKYYNRVLALSPSHLKKNAYSIRYVYLAIFCLIKKQDMTDTLTDLLLQLLKRILTKAERSVDKALALDNKRTKGKMGTLLALAKKSVDNPDGIIKNTIYPDITQERLLEIISDLGEDGQWYRNQVKTKALSLYTHNNRRIVWKLMNVLNFEASPVLSRLLKAIQFMAQLNKENVERVNVLKERLFDPILFKKIVPTHWLPFVSVKTDHPTKVRINGCAFELALFEQLKVYFLLKTYGLNMPFAIEIQKRTCRLTLTNVKIIILTF